MTEEQLKHLQPKAFKRRCGLQPDTFNLMFEILNPHLDRKVRLSVLKKQLLLLQKVALNGVIRFVAGSMSSSWLLMLVPEWHDAPNRDRLHAHRFAQCQQL
jgi:hypothetical protein